MNDQCGGTDVQCAGSLHGVSELQSQSQAGAQVLRSFRDVRVQIHTLPRLQMIGALSIRSSAFSGRSARLSGYIRPLTCRLLPRCAGPRVCVRCSRAAGLIAGALRRRTSPAAPGPRWGGRGAQSPWRFRRHRVPAGHGAGRGPLQCPARIFATWSSRRILFQSVQTFRKAIRALTGRYRSHGECSTHKSGGHMPAALDIAASPRRDQLLNSARASTIPLPCTSSSSIASPPR